LNAKSMKRPALRGGEVLSLLGGPDGDRGGGGKQIEAVESNKLRMHVESKEFPLDGPQSATFRAKELK